MLNELDEKQEIDFLFQVNEMIISHYNIIQTFTCLPSNNLIIPYCKILNVVQEEKQCDVLIKRNICNKNIKNNVDAIYRSIIASTDIINDIDNVLFQLNNGESVKINKNDIIHYKQSITIIPLFNTTPIYITSEHKNIINMEFSHVLNKNHNLSSYYLQQKVILENTSNFQFNIDNKINIVIPKRAIIKNTKSINTKTSEQIIPNTSILIDVDVILPYSKIYYNISNTELFIYKYYHNISIINNSIEKIVEFLLQDEIYPGNITIFENKRITAKFRV